MITLLITGHHYLSLSELSALKLKTNNEGAEQRAPSLSLSPRETPSVIYYLPLGKAGHELESVARSFSSHRRGCLLNALSEGLPDPAKQNLPGNGSS